ncbi:MAG: hypothetical protein AAGI23_22100 [Bacteroidota bacterium]
MNIPENDHFYSFTEEVFPIPKGLLFGGIIYQGSEYIEAANQYFDALDSLGLIETTVPNYKYRHLQVETDGRPADKHWDTDEHILGLFV